MVLKIITIRIMTLDTNLLMRLSLLIESYNLLGSVTPTTKLLITSLLKISKISSISLLVSLDKELVCLDLSTRFTRDTYLNPKVSLTLISTLMLRFKSSTLKMFSSNITYPLRITITKYILRFVEEVKVLNLSTYGLKTNSEMIFKFLPKRSNLTSRNISSSSLSVTPLVNLSLKKEFVSCGKVFIMLLILISMSRKVSVFLRLSYKKIKNLRFPLLLLSSVMFLKKRVTLVVFLPRKIGMFQKVTKKSLILERTLFEKSI